MPKNCYLLECLDQILLQKEIHSVILENGYQEEEITYYDLEDGTISQVVENLDTYSFLTPRKVVVIKNALFLKATTEVKFTEKEINDILKYLKQPATDVLFIMGVDKCDERKKVVKEIKKLVNVKKIEISSDNLLKTNLGDYKISKETINLILEYCQNDVSKIMNECEKLKIYTSDTKEITNEIVEELITKKIPDTDKLAFDFVKYIAKRDKKKILEHYKLLQEYNFEPHSIIGLMESQIRLIYQVMLANRKGMRKDEMATHLKEHPFRIQKTLEFLSYYQEKELQSLIHKLHALDYKIKSGQVDATIGFEIFLISL